MQLKKTLNRFKQPRPEIRKRLNNFSLKGGLALQRESKTLL